MNALGLIVRLERQTDLLDPPGLGCVLHLAGVEGGGAVIQDRGPYGIGGAIIGATWVSTEGGLWCLSFDGADDYVSCGSPDALDLTTGLTLSVWANCDRATGAGERMAVAEKGPGDVWAIYMEQNDAGYYVALKVGGSYRYTKIADSSIGKWLNLTATFDGAVRAVYANGAPVSSAPDAGSLSIAGQAFTLSRASGRVFNGKIALAKVYGRALSPAEIRHGFERERRLFGVW